MINEPNVKADAAVLVAEFDAGNLSWAVEDRRAALLADFWVESQFARSDEDCDWTEEKSDEMFDLMVEELRGLGLP